MSWPVQARRAALSPPPSCRTGAKSRRELQERLEDVEIELEDVEAERRNHADMKLSMIEGEPPLMGSSWQSLTRGGSIETDYLNGEIVLQGRLHGVATPVNRALQVAANRLAREGGKPGDLSLAELRSLVDEYDSPGAA